MVRVPGYPGATNQITTAVQVNPYSTNATQVETIFQYEECFIVDGHFWVPKTAGALNGWEY